MRRVWTAARSAAAMLAFVLASCGGSGSGSSPSVRVVNAADNAPYNFDVLVNSVSAATDLGYLQATAFQSIGTGSTSVEFEPTGTTTNAMTANFSADNGFNYSTLALQGSGGLTTVVAAQTNTAVPSGQARLTFVGASPGAGSLDLFITAPTVGLPASPSMPAVSYAGDGSVVVPTPLLFTAGAYRIRATAAGGASQSVVFDSGRISLASGDDLLLAIIPSTGTAATFSLLVLDANSNVYQILDQRVQLRVGNFAPAVGSVAAYLNAPNSMGSTGTLLASGMALGAASAYQTELPSSYRVSLTATGQSSEISGLGSNVALAPSTAVSMFAIGLSNQSSPYNLQLLSLQDNLQAPATGMAKLRVVQLAPDINNGGNTLLDVVVLNGSGAISSPPLVSSLAYPGASQYLSLPAGSYTIALVPSGLNAPLLPSASGTVVNLTDGSVQTLVVAGCQTPGSGICSAAPAASALQLVPLLDN